MPPFWPERDYCNCVARVLTEAAGQFVLARPFGGYVFPQGKTRRCVKPWAVEDHTGDPYVFVTCPWCGKDLDIG